MTSSLRLTNWRRVGAASHGTDSFVDNGQILKFRQTDI
jgi:hypothetical protein